jgi:hypothetical protein
MVYFVFKKSNDQVDLSQASYSQYAYFRMFFISFFQFQSVKWMKKSLNSASEHMLVWIIWFLHKNGSSTI